jgi:hypothetical protein
MKIVTLGTGRSIGFKISEGWTNCEMKEYGNSKPK